MKAPHSLESRIARIAEQYGDGTLRAYATEAGEVVAERDRFRRRNRLFLWVYWPIGAAAIVYVMMLKGWL